MAGELVMFDVGWTVNSEDPYLENREDDIQTRRTCLHELAIMISSGRGGYNLYLTMTGLGWIMKNATINP